MPGETILVIDDSPTILKVVQLVLSKAGFNITTASDGEQGVALARDQRPDLILLDFVMPRMNGYQVCRALAGDAELKDIPVVLMSAKGDQVGERFVKVMGIVDYITKPFSPEAITAVVQHTAAKYGRRRAAGEPLGADESELPVGDNPLLVAEAQAREHVLDEVRDAIAEAISPRIAGVVALANDAVGDEAMPQADARVPTDADAIADAARDALDGETLSRILGAVRPGMFAGGTDTTPGNHEDAALQGDLRLIPIAEVLQLLQVQSHSGILSVTRARGRVEVFFRQGRIDFARGVNLGEEFLMGRFIVGLSLMSKPDLETFIASRSGAVRPVQSNTVRRSPETRPLGQQLVKLGYLSETEVKQVITKQTCELVYEILRWNFGRFAFRATRDLPPLAIEAGLGLEVNGILMEGFRRVNEWHLIEREIENFNLVFLRNEDAVAQMGRGRLTREELTILEQVNGKNTVKEIIRQSRMGSFDVSKMLYRLLSIKLIQRRVMPVAVKNVLLVALGDASYALELRWVREIFTLGNMTTVPTAPPVISGVVNFKGAIVPVLHARRLLGVAGRRAPMAGDALVLVDVEGTRAALAVDRIDAVTTLELARDGSLVDAEARPVPLIEPPALIAAARGLVEGTKDAGEGGHGARA